MRDVVAGGERLGHLGVALRHPPAALDAVLVEQAAIMCALELTRERAVLEARTRVRGDFLWDLLDGKIADAAEALLWARALHVELPERVRVAVIRARTVRNGATPAGPVPQLDLRESLAQLAERAVRRGTALAAARGSLISLLLPAADDPGAARAGVEAVVDRLAERFAGDGDRRRGERARDRARRPAGGPRPGAGSRSTPRPWTRGPATSRCSTSSA